VLNFVSYKNLTINCSLWKYNCGFNVPGMVAKCKTTQTNDKMESIKGWFKSNLIKKKCMHRFIERRKDPKKTYSLKITKFQTKILKCIVQLASTNQFDRQWKIFTTMGYLKIRCLFYYKPPDIEGNYALGLEKHQL
jgi:hypothetical protein